MKLCTVEIQPCYLARQSKLLTFDLLGLLKLLSPFSTGPFKYTWGPWQEYTLRSPYGAFKSGSETAIQHLGANKTEKAVV